MPVSVCRVSCVWEIGSAGAGRGGAAAPSNTIVDFVAYPTAPFYLDDLWFYNFTSELWNKARPILYIKFDKTSWDISYYKVQHAASGIGKLRCAVFTRSAL